MSPLYGYFNFFRYSTIFLLNFEDLDDDDEEEIARAGHARGVSFTAGPRDSGCRMSTSTSISRQTSGNGASASESSGRFTGRRRIDSECSATTSCERDRLEFSNLLARKARKTDVHAEKMRRLEGEISFGSEEDFDAGIGRASKDSVLGQVCIPLSNYFLVENIKIHFFLADSSGFGEVPRTWSFQRRRLGG